MPRVSVLLTSYNHLAYLRAAISSVREQSFRDYELIILDDGSTDGSREWLSDHERQTELVFSEKNLGTYGILNLGLEHAKGEWIAILNDDDLWSPEKLAKQLELVDREPRLGLVGTQGHFIDGSGREIDAFLGDVYDPLGPGDALATLVLGNVFVTSSVLFRREALGPATRFDSELFGLGDYDLWLRISERWWCAKAEGDLVSYRFHGAQASKYEARMVAETQSVEERLFRDRHSLLESRSGDSNLRSALALMCSRIGTQRMWRGDRSGAREAYRASLELDPDRSKTKLRLALTWLPPKIFRLLR